MKPFRLTPAASAHLDVMRAIAAVAVMFGHVRTLFFVDFRQVTNKTLIVQAFYFLTGFGHQAVVIFFVLSGLFIGPSVLEAVANGKWSWKQYAINRCSRLLIVLVPALLISAGLDYWGQRLPGAQLCYQTPLPNYGDWTVVQRETVPIFVGNLLFLQSIVTPPFGSDAPLWSLSYEFWYYVLFPLAVLCLADKTRNRKLLWGLAAVIVAWFVGRWVMLASLIWLMGVVVAELHARRSEARSILLPLAGASVLLAATLAAQRLIASPSLADFVLAIAAAVFVSVVLQTNGSVIARLPGKVYERFAHFTAGFSYTVYVTHLPLVLFLRAFSANTLRWQPSAGTALRYLGITILTLGYCYLFSLATEAHTGKLRAALKRWL